MPSSRILVPLIASLLALTACGVTSDSSGPGPSDTTAVHEPPSLEQLATLLPDAADLGEGYELVASHDAPSEEDQDDPLGVDPALIEACGPVVADWIDTGSGSSREGYAYHHFDGSHDQGVQVEIGHVDRDVSDDQLSELVEAIRGCERASIDLEDGLTMDVQVSAATEGEIGEQAIRVFMDITLIHDDLPRPVTASAEGITYTTGPVSVMVMITDGFDEQRLRTVPGDMHLVDRLAIEIEAGILDLLD